MLLTRAGLVLVVTSLAAGVRGASAAEERAALRLEWSAPAGCPGAAEVRALTAGVLGREVAEDVGAATRVRARVRRAAGGFRLTIETRSASGTDVRRLEDRRCGVLAEAAAVIAAAAIDGSGVSGGVAEGTGGGVAEGTGGGVAEGTGGGVDEGSRGTGGGAAGGGVSEGTGDVSEGTGGEDVSGGTGGPVVVPMAPRAGLRPVAGPRAPVVVPLSEAVEVPEGAEVAAARRAVAGRRVRVGVRVAGVFDVGGTPGPTGGLALAGALIGRRWRAELYGLWLAARTARPEPTLALGARVGLLAAGLRGCGVPGVGRFEFPLCGGLEAGGLRGAGSGSALVRSERDTLPWLAVSAGPGLWWSPAPRVGLGLGLDVVVPLLPTRFRVAGYAEDVYAGARAAGRGLLAVELRF